MVLESKNFKKKKNRVPGIKIIRKRLTLIEFSQNPHAAQLLILAEDQNPFQLCFTALNTFWFFVQVFLERNLTFLNILAAFKRFRH